MVYSERNVENIDIVTIAFGSLVHSIASLVTTRRAHLSIFRHVPILINYFIKIIQSIQYFC